MKYVTELVKRGVEIPENPTYRYGAGQTWRRDPRKPDLQVRSCRTVSRARHCVVCASTYGESCTSLRHLRLNGESCTSLRRLRLNNESCTLLRRLRLNVTSKLFSFTTFNYEADAGNVS